MSNKADQRKTITIDKQRRLKEDKSTYQEDTVILKEYAPKGRASKTCDNEVKMDRTGNGAVKSACCSF